MAGLMEGKRLFPFMYKGTVYTAGLDGKREAGMYYLNEGGKSVNGWTAYGTIIVFTAFEGQLGFCTQIFIHAEGLICFRTSTNQSTWNPWKII